MEKLEWTQLIIYFMLILLPIPFLGRYMAKVIQGQRNVLTPFIRPLEVLTYRICKIDEKEEMNWKKYASSVAVFSILGIFVLLVLQLFQGGLPFNPQKMPGVSFWLAFNTAVSFVTNTNWQAYSGESSLSYLVQSLGLTVQSFLSAAMAMGVMAALIRGLTRKRSSELGNFWVDLVRCCYYILLPISFVAALVLMSEGVVQSISPYIEATTLEGVKQIIPLGPAASQIAIKQLGTNGGGFFGMNSAHPFENPTGLSNLIELVFILLIPAALTYTYGIMVGARRHGLVLLAAMGVIFAISLGIAIWSEYQPNPALGGFSFLEGKETRFGIMNSVIWSQATTAASNGSVNAMHSSLSPLTGGLTLFNMALGEVVFGGVGCGLYGIVLFVIITVFIAGLMVGRTPEYLGKKIESYEVKLTAVAVLAPSAVALTFAALSCLSPDGVSSVLNKGPHGLSEILYAFLSPANNNGSAFAGLNANTTYYNILTSIAMLVGRFSVIFPILAIAGSLAHKDITPSSSGTFPTDRPLFVALLISIILLVAGLTFFPVLTLGPFLEHLLMLKGGVF